MQYPYQIEKLTGMKNIYSNLHKEV